MKIQTQIKKAVAHLNLTWEPITTDEQGDENLIHVDKNDYAFMFYYSDSDPGWVGWAEGIATRSGFSWDGSGTDPVESAIERFEEWLAPDELDHEDEDEDEDEDDYTGRIQMDNTEYNELHYGKD